MLAKDQSGVLPVASLTQEDPCNSKSDVRKDGEFNHWVETDSDNWGTESESKRFKCETSSCHSSSY